VISFSPLGSFTAETFGLHPLWVIIFGSFGLATLFPRELSIVFGARGFCIEIVFANHFFSSERQTCFALYMLCNTKRQQSALRVFMSEG